MTGTTRASPRGIFTSDASPFTAQSDTKTRKCPLKAFQGYKCRKLRGDGTHQATSASVKVELIPQMDPLGQGTLGDIKADPEDNLQPAQDTAEDIPSIKPAAGPRRNPGRSAAAAGIAKRIRSETEDAPSEPQAKRSRTTRSPQARPAQLTAAGQRSGNPAVEVAEVIFVDVKPHAASSPNGRQAQLGRQEAQAVQGNGPGREAPAEQGRRFGNLVRDVQQQIIIGDQSAHWAKGQTKPRPYGNTNNKFWAILKDEEIVSDKAIEGDEHDMLAEIGFMDIGLATWPSGNASAEGGGNFWAPRRKKNSEWFKNHAPRFYARLYEHMVRASDAMMCTCGECGAPAFFVWNGKTTWKKLLEASGIGTRALEAIKCGLQTIKPKDWPLPEQTKVYMMPSTSGSNKAHFDNDGGQAAWKALGEEMRAAFAAREWPFKPKCY